MTGPETSASTPAVAAEGITIAYGRTPVLGGVDLAVGRGEVYALLGRNGSGKSSLVRTLLGQQRPRAGRARLLGADAWRDRHRVMDRVGVVAEDPVSPPEMTPRGLAAFRRRFYRDWDEAGCRARLERFAVPLGTPFGTLSRGQKKQVELALALAPRPELLVLDDPTLGLDAIARRAFFEELVDELAESGTTVLLTTHDLAAVERVADRVGILHRCRLVVDAPLEELKGRFHRVRGPAVAAVPAAALVASRNRSWGPEAIVDGTAAAISGTADALDLEEIFAALAGTGEGSR